ncbi:MAG: GNAT family N-acetyltransferase [Pirellulales bacterium]|nr:GNAT family N-acetyltransferase [Pirellulales bacterium]
MPDLSVIPAASRREKQDFLRFPWTLYRDDPRWIPPLRANQKELVGYRSHPFYERNEVQTFVAYRGGTVCGRIAAILNRGHIERHDDPRGFFGFFECVDDQEVATGLFDAVRNWFAARGIHALRGPTNPSLNHELGLLIAGFDKPPTFMMTYNPRYYERLVEDYGFRKTQDLYSYWGHVDMLPKIHERLAPISEQIVEHMDLTLRTLDRSRFREEVMAFLDVYNRSLVNTWGFVPMSDAEVRHTAAALRYLIVPELAVVAEIEGKVIGVVFGLPDYNPRIKQIDGRLFPFGFWRLLRRKQDIKKIRLISTNVVPEYHRSGVGLALTSSLVPKALEWGLQEAEFSWVLESNSLSRGSLEKGGALIDKTYRLYDLDTKPEPSDQSSPERVASERPAPRIASPASGTSGSISTGSVDIRPVTTSRDLDRFAKMPWPIYANDPQWVPPLLVEVKEFLNPRKHPFYQHGAAASFLATRDGRPVGRILVSDDPKYNALHETNVGCFGMFESIDDPAVAHALLDAAAAWLLERGRDTILGPINYSTNYPVGLLIDGFDTPPRVMMNHNPPYYAGLLESWGLTKAKDLYCWWFVDPLDMVAKWHRKAERIAKRSNVVVRPFNLKDFDADVERCRAVYNTARTKSWGFSQLTDDEFKYFAKQLARLAIPELVLLAEVDDKPVGFSITLPDVNEAIAPLGGRLTTLGLPIGLLRFLHRLPRVKTARMLVLDLLEGYRRRGISELLILKTLDYGKNTIGYTGAELSWTLEDNYLINRTVEAVGAQRYKTYRIYEKRLDDRPSQSE